MCMVISEPAFPVDYSKQYAFENQKFPSMAEVSSWVVNATRQSPIPQLQEDACLQGWQTEEIYTGADSACVDSSGTVENISPGYGYD